MSPSRKFVLIVLNVTIIYLVSGAVIASNYYYRNHDNPHRDMFGTQGAFLVGGVIGVALCLGNIGFVAYQIVTSKGFFKTTFLYSTIAGVSSGLVAAIVAILIDPRFSIQNCILVTILLAVLPGSAIVYQKRMGRA